MTARVRAPGKLMLAGEYAVLYGHPALVMAVDRHAVATAHEGPHPTVFREIDETFALARAEGLIDAHRDDVVVDATALQGDGARKLGLGSSAAACVAALGWAFAQRGRTLDEGARHEIARLARAGHRRAQGGGSGVDVIASALGGVVRVKLHDDREAMPAVTRHAGMQGVPWAVLWSGTPARTSDMVAKVETLRACDPLRFDGLVRAIAACAKGMDEGLRAGDARAVVEAAAAHQRAMADLGDAAHAPIVTGPMRRLAARVEPMGAACKPSGAGGGDVCVAFAHDAGALAAALDAAREAGFTVVALNVDGAGVSTA